MILYQNKKIMLDAMRKLGRERAAELRQRSIDGADGTEIIENEIFIPDYPEDGKRDFSNVPIYSPYAFNGQVYKLWQQHNANGQPDWTPDKAVSLWDICHTKDPRRAKPYMAPQGARGLYHTDECMIWTDGKVYASEINNNSWTPETYPNGWRVINVD